MSKGYSLNLEKLCWEATEVLLKLDNNFVGTEKYMGLTYFWDYEYRHYLRDCSISSRKRVHKKLLEAQLSVDGMSEKHLCIIKKYVRPKK